MRDSSPMKGMVNYLQSAAVQLMSVSKNYILGPEMVVRALRNVFLTIERSEYIGIVGRSGSGKTTLLNLAAALDTPSEGDVYINGRNVALCSDRELTRLRRTDVGIVFQRDALLEGFTAAKNVEMPMRVARVPKRERGLRTASLLSRVGLVNRENHKPRELSGGERQRVAIARALANNPTILCADEPTANLDSVAAENVMEIFQQLNRDYGGFGTRSKLSNCHLSH
jgi:putative ABC transport system ATP-binding protein